MRSRTAIVAASEFLTLVRTKAFLIGVLLMPVFMGGTIVFQRMTETRVDASTRTFAVVDRSGAVFPVLAAAVDEWNALAVGPDGQPRAPRFVTVEVKAGEAAPDALRLSLSERVRRGELFAFVEIPEDAARAPAGAGPAIQYHSNHPSYEVLPRFLETAIGRAVLALRFRAAGVDLAQMDALTRAPDLQVLGLFERDPAGRLKSAEQVDRIRSVAVPGAFMALMFLVVMSSSPQLLNSVMEEKMSRISEVIVSSITPFQLMMGKLLGGAAVSMLLAVVYLAGAYRAAAYWGYADALTWPLVAWFLVFLICAVLLFGALFVSIGAACSDFKDAQSMMTPAMLIVMLPVFTWTAVLRAPDSALAVGLSLVPPATPFLMLLRMTLRPSPPTWQVVLSLVLVLATVVAAVWAAGRIFRTGILMHGKSATVGEMIRWVRAG